MLKCMVCDSNVVEIFTRDLVISNRQHMKPLKEFARLDVTWKFYECVWCHAVQTYALDDLTWDELALFYSYEGSYINQSVNRAHRAVRFVNRAIQIFPQKGKDLLSYGAGMSPEPGLLRGLGWKVTTCDFGSNHDFSPKDFQDHRNKYNVITYMEVLEHLRFPDKELSKILQHLLPGGIFVASTGLWSRLDVEKRGPNWWYVSHCSEGHVFFWTLQALDIVAQKNDCFVSVLGNTPKLCAGMRGSGQAPIIIRKYGAEDL